MFVLGLLLYLCVFITALTVSFVVIDSIYFYFKIVKEKGKPKTTKFTFKESSVLFKIFRDFPRLLGRYFYEIQDNFKDYGIIVFYGEQGCGKTMAVTHYAQKIYTRYPKSLIGSNYDLLIEDFKIKNWKTLIKQKNGNEPIIFCIDELSQWANSRDWQSMPKNVLSELCYQRKNKRLILGTAQSISQIDKQIRLQCACGEFRRCHTLLGFITLVIRIKPEFDESGNLTGKHFKGFYIFLQDEVLRYLYDTYQVIERLSECKIKENNQ